MFGHGADPSLAVTNDIQGRNSSFKVYFCLVASFGFTVQNLGVEIEKLNDSGREAHTSVCFL